MTSHRVNHLCKRCKQRVMSTFPNCPVLRHDLLRSGRKMQLSKQIFLYSPLSLFGMECFGSSNNIRRGLPPVAADIQFSMPPFTKQRGVEVCFNLQTGIGGSSPYLIFGRSQLRQPRGIGPRPHDFGLFWLTAKSQPLGVEPLFDRLCKRCKQRNNGNADYHVLRHELWLDEKLNCPKQIFLYSPLLFLMCVG